MIRLGRNLGEQFDWAQNNGQTKAASDTLRNLGYFPICCRYDGSPAVFASVNVSDERTFVESVQKYMDESGRIEGAQIVYQLKSPVYIRRNSMSKAC